MLHFVHVVSTYDALIKTPKGGEGNTHQTLDFVSQIALSRIRVSFAFSSSSQAGILRILKSTRLYYLKEFTRELM